MCLFRHVYTCCLFLRSLQSQRTPTYCNAYVNRFIRFVADKHTTILQTTPNKF